jgi:hypothetical protein
MQPSSVNWNGSDSSDRSAKPSLSSQGMYVIHPVLARVGFAVRGTIGVGIRMCCCWMNLWASEGGGGGRFVAPWIGGLGFVLLPILCGFGFRHMALVTGCLHVPISHGLLISCLVGIEGVLPFVRRGVRTILPLSDDTSCRWRA